jgi:hypothetical protein
LPLHMTSPLACSKPVAMVLGFFGCYGEESGLALQQAA